MLITNLTLPSSATMAMIFTVDFQHYSTLFVLWLFSALFLFFMFKKPRNSNLPPSPPAYPLIGHLHLLSRVFFQSFQEISAKYGPLLYLRFGSFKCVLVSSPTLASEMFRNHDITLSGKPKTPFQEKLLFGNAGFITSQYGDHWKFMKKLSMTELLGPKQIMRSRGIRHEERIRFLQKMMAVAEKNEQIQLDGELFMLTNNALRRMALGESGTGGEDGVAELCRDMVLGYLHLAEKITIALVAGWLKSVVFWMYQKQLIGLTRRFDEFMDKILEEHEESRREGKEKESKDVVDLLLEAYHDEKADVNITKTQIKAFILDLFIAGTSSQADTTQWALAELINQPHVFKKAREEIESAVGRSRLVEEADLPNLPYLQAIVKETLRLHAPLPVIPRLSLQSFKIGDYDIPRETVILVNAQSMMRDPSLWDNPNEFYPERFLHLKENNVDYTQGKGLNFNYLPFGVGRRMCPGNALGQTQVSAILATMIQCFDWEVVGTDKVSLELGIGTTARMAHPLKCIPRLHCNAFAA